MEGRIERIRQSFSPRKIEENDTQDSIKRHDPDFQKNKGNRPHDDWQDHDEDMADISVESLIIFLKGLMGETQTSLDVKIDDDTNPRAKAMQAYGARQQNAKHPDIEIDDNVNDYAGGKIVNLIHQLQKLLSIGCTHIDLIQGDDFLDSIEKTVEKYHAV